MNQKTCWILNITNNISQRLKNIGPGSVITSPVIPGTIQLTPSGKMIALMKDGQVSGGYPRILQMNDLSISILSQKKQGDRIKFKIVELT